MARLTVLTLTVSFNHALFFPSVPFSYFPYSVQFFLLLFSLYYSSSSLILLFPLCHPLPLFHLIGSF